MKKQLLAEIGTGFLVLLFIYTGSIKLMEHNIFQIQLSLSPLLKPVSLILSWILPITEITLAALMIFSRTKLLGYVLSAGLLLGFIVYLTYMVSNYNNLPCTCGGIINKMTWKQHIYFNIFSLLTSVALILNSIKSKIYKLKDTALNYQSQ